MSTLMSWLARVSLCVALTTPAMLATSANADTKSSTKTGAAAAQKVSSTDLACLSEALYFEARGEGAKGQQAVAEVILNRVDHPRFPKSVCGVVNQKGQFTYRKTRIREQGAFSRAQKIAKAALQGGPRNLTNGATYFHAGRVKPSWSRKFERTTRIGSHTFYRSGHRIASN
ncbi:cell wall hydrolase [Paracoccus aestuariivivens]|uniref:Cell wall hydrolase n=1 Tax=Paracoccus aestuariivivens TaxID=1820333 RepID=A0A6L6J4K9_9RHOB|nr:cell wall hydrolase [Paracoccus aestuariivivens]MTH76486.1 cell wall hydrolase [Paracoccus aestuariivivens]